MKPTEILMQEHRVIEQVLDCLEKIADEAEGAGRLNREDAAAAVRFFLTFADACHHGKEEDRLFPAMVARGVPREVGPIGVMLSEHEIGRAAVRGMAAAVESDEAGEPDAIASFVRHARDLIGMLRDHIAKEDNILFPLADSVLDEECQRELMASFESFEHEDMGEGVHGEMLAIADGLAARHGVSLAAERAPRGFGGCMHQHP